MTTVLVIVAGTLALVSLGVGAGWRKGRRRALVRSPRDLSNFRASDPLLAVVPRIASDDERANGTGPVGPAQAAFRQLFERLLTTNGDGEALVVQITSAAAGAGVTTLACNLGLAAARAGRRALVIDANLRAPSVHRYFVTDSRPGVVEYLGGGMQDVPLRRSRAGVMVLTAGAPQHRPLETLSRRGLDELIERLRSEYDFIVVDSPAASVGGDARLVSRWADGVVVVARCDHTSIHELRRCLSALHLANATTLGIVLNGFSD